MVIEVPQYPYAAAGLGCSGAMLGLSFSQPGKIWQPFLSQGVLFGLAVAFGVQPALAVVGQHFKKRRALAMGLVAAGSSVGGVSYPLMFTRLVPRIGFAWSIRIAAFISLFCYITGYAISSTQVVPKGGMKLTGLLDFRGFLDARYTVLAIGSFVASLGLYIPYYYIGEFPIVLKAVSKLTTV